MQARRRWQSFMQNLPRTPFNLSTFTVRRERGPIGSTNLLTLSSTSRIVLLSAAVKRATQDEVMMQFRADYIAQRNKRSHRPNQWLRILSHYLSISFSSHLFSFSCLVVGSALWHAQQDSITRLELLPFFFHLRTAWRHVSSHHQ